MDPRFAAAGFIGGLIAMMALGLWFRSGVTPAKLAIAAATVVGVVVAYNLLHI